MNDPYLKALETYTQALKDNYTPEWLNRFLSKIGPKDPVTGCCEWTATTVKGYGRFRARSLGSSPLVASRLAYTLFVKPLHKGEFVCHHCDNPSCVNVEHLFAGSQKDNMQDCRRKGRVRNSVKLGESNPASVLTKAQVKEIRSIPKHYGMCSKLGRIYGVTHRTISLILNRKTWKNG